MSVSHVPREALSRFLARRAVPPPPPQTRSAVVWGEPQVASVAARAAAAAAARGLAVAIIDAALACDLTAYAHACRLPPAPLLRQLHLARAFTGHQFTTLRGERLDPRLVSHHLGLVVLLGPCTTFFDAPVPFTEAVFLFPRVLRKMREVRAHGPLRLMAQGLEAYHTRRIAFVRELVRTVEVGSCVRPVEGRRHVQRLHPREPAKLQPFPSRAPRQPPEVATHGPHASPLPSAPRARTSRLGSVQESPAPGGSGGV